MDFYSVWPFFGLLGLLLLLTATPLFAAADTPPSSSPDRVRTIDGLRGFLALAVFFHHTAIYHDYLVNGEWRYPPTRFYGVLGPMGVSMFFMITGYLFWSRLIRTSGKPGWIPLFLGRIFRIGPVYLATIALMILAIFVLDRFQILVSGYQLVRAIGKWSALGYFADYPDVNGYHGTWILVAGVTWSIHYEWLFYFSLLITGLATRHPRTHLPCVALALAACLMWAAWHPSGRGPVILTSLFLIGMLCASLDDKGWILSTKTVYGSFALLLLLSSVFFFGESYAVLPVLLVGAAFYVIVGGCDVFGLLLARPARRLGNISYGIYLLQGLVLAAFFQPQMGRDIALASPLYHWGLVIVAAIILAAAATLAHVVVERPGIALGKRLTFGFRARFSPLSAT